MHTFLDESGDLGKKGSKYLVMTMLATEDIELLDNLIKSIKKNLSKHKKGRLYLKKLDNEIKYTNFPDKKLLNSTLETIASSNTKIFSVYIDKSKICRNIKMEEKELIFKYLLQIITSKNFDKNCKNLKHGLDECITKTFDFIKTKGLTKITADLSFLKKAPKKTKEYCINKTFEKHKKYGDIFDITFEEINLENKNKCDLIIKVDLKNSRTNTKLQVTDLICGAIYDFLENENIQNYLILKNKLELFEEITKEIQ
jgi:hypothetical protein